VGVVRLAGHGRTVQLPPGWEGRIYRRPVEEADATSQPVLHAGSFALPEDRGDFGSDATDLMGAGDVFLSLVEYDPEAAGTALFSSEGPPWPVSPRAFSTRQLQRHIPGQSGAQFFFSHRGRAYCLYVVLGDHGRRETLLPTANEVLASVELSPVELEGAEGGEDADA
jgi:hypothetical protein